MVEMVENESHVCTRGRRCFGAAIDPAKAHVRGVSREKHESECRVKVDVGTTRKVLPAESAAETAALALDNDDDGRRSINAWRLGHTRYEDIDACK